MNIDNYFGAHQGRFGPVLIFLLVSILPIVVYLTLFIGVIPVSVIVVVEVLFAARMALLILGNENKRLVAYKKMLNEEYETIADIVRIVRIHKDGLVEYTNGTVVYIISAFTNTCLDDEKFVRGVESFFDQLKDYNFDIHLHLVVDEIRLQDDLESMQVYTDQDMVRERVKFYMLQDKYCTDNTMLYRYNIVVKSSKMYWKTLKNDLVGACNSHYAQVFKECYVCDKQQAEDVISRDIGAYVDVDELLRDKYKNDVYYGARVLFYGDEIPEEYKPEVERVDLEDRRVVDYK